MFRAETSPGLIAEAYPTRMIARSRIPMAVSASMDETIWLSSVTVSGWAWRRCAAPMIRRSPRLTRRTTPDAVGSANPSRWWRWAMPEQYPSSVPKVSPDSAFSVRNAASASGAAGRGTRDDHAVYTRDHVLDLEIEPDRSLARKDEDELALVVEQGRFDAAMAAEIEADAAEVEALVHDRGQPFCDGWEQFRPDPAWPIPPTGTRLVT